MRNKRLNDQLRDVVAKIVEEELDVEGTPLVTVMGAEISPTMEHAMIKISVLPEKQSPLVLKELHRRIYDLQQLVNKRMAMRPVPKIRFVIDSTEANAARIEQLLEEVVE